MSSIYIVAGEASRLAWDDLVRGFGMILTGIFACIAAFSSIKNGKILRNNGFDKISREAKNQPAARQTAKKKAAEPPDWYVKPDV
jgi:hypothetical protein